MASLYHKHKIEIILYGRLNRKKLNRIKSTKCILLTYYYNPKLVRY